MQKQPPLYTYSSESRDAEAARACEALLAKHAPPPPQKMERRGGEPMTAADFAALRAQGFRIEWAPPDGWTDSPRKISAAKLAAAIEEAVAAQAEGERGRLMEIAERHGVRYQRLVNNLMVRRKRDGICAPVYSAVKRDAQLAAAVEHCEAATRAAMPDRPPHGFFLNAAREFGVRYGALMDHLSRRRIKRSVMAAKARKAA